MGPLWGLGALKIMPRRGTGRELAPPLRDGQPRQHLRRGVTAVAARPLRPSGVRVKRCCCCRRRRRASVGFCVVGGAGARDPSPPRPAGSPSRPRPRLLLFATSQSVPSLLLAVPSQPLANTLQPVQREIPSLRFEGPALKNVQPAAACLEPAPPSSSSAPARQIKLRVFLGYRSSIVRFRIRLQKVRPPAAFPVPAPPLLLSAAFQSVFP